MSRLTVAHLRRTLTPGTRVRIVNHRLPHISRDTRVHAKTNTVDLCTWAVDKSGQEVASHTPWPKAAELRGDDADPDTFHIDSTPRGPRGQATGDPVPFLTVTVIRDDHPEAADWPETVCY